MIDIEKEIEQAILQQPVDLQLLRKLSRRKGGFQNNKLRVRVWPKLMDVNRYNIDDFRQEIDTHKDDSQILVDVERSLWDIEIVKNWRDSYRDRRRKALSDIIMSILSRNKGLHYYQGFHDVVSVFLLVFQDDHLAFAVSEKVALSFMTDFMQKDFELVCQFMKIVLLIIQSADPELHNHFVAAKMEPFFTTSWLLTWFSHDLKNFESIARLFDTLLSSPPIYIYYLSAAYVINLREHLLETEADFAMMHSTLARAPEKFGFPIEELIVAADKLMITVTVDILKSLSDKKLLQLINSKKIMSIARPCFTKNSTDSDWCLLEHMRLVPDKRNSWGIPNIAFRTLWTHGYNLTFLTSYRLRTLEQYRQNVETFPAVQRAADKHLTEGTIASSPKSVPFTEKHTVLDIVCGAIDELLYLLFIQIRKLREGELLLEMDKKRYPSWRIGLFWSITVAVSGTIIYSVWNHHHMPHTATSECSAI